jgi:hypothetical protein
MASAGSLVIQEAPLAEETGAARWVARTEGAPVEISEEETGVEGSEAATAEGRAGAGFSAPARARLRSRGAAR